MANPDETHIENDQFVQLDRERFQIPELLFNPSDVMIRQVQCDFSIRIPISVLCTLVEQKDLIWKSPGLNVPVTS